jgi:hypothetical protein
MYGLLGCWSKLSVYNKVLLYKQVLRPVWTYDVQLWECAKEHNIDIIQRYQNKVLRCLVFGMHVTATSIEISVSKQSHPSFRDMLSHTKIVFSITAMKKRPGFSMCNI